MNPDEKNELATPEQLAELFDGTMGRPTSMLDTLTVYRSGKEDYFRRGEDKVENVTGVLLYSQRPMRTWWSSEEISDKPPECYSLDGIKPHADSQTAQADACGDCPWDKFGTASKGRGKACKTRAADFILEVNALDLSLPQITKTSLPVIDLDPKRVMGPALIRYGIGNREAADNYASIVRFAKERGTYIQGLLCRWGFVKGKSKSNVEYDVVIIEPLARLADAVIQSAIVPLVRTLKGGQALQVLTALAGTKEAEEPGAHG